MPNVEEVQNNDTVAKSYGNINNNFPTMMRWEEKISLIDV